MLKSLVIDMESPLNKRNCINYNLQTSKIKSFGIKGAPPISLYGKLVKLFSSLIPKQAIWLPFVQYAYNSSFIKCASTVPYKVITQVFLPYML